MNEPKQRQPQANSLPKQPSGKGAKVWNIVQKALTEINGHPTAPALLTDSSCIVFALFAPS
jgi:hypothetical protein